MTRPLLALVLVLSVRAWAQGEAPATGQLTKAPQLLSAVEAAWPKAEADAGPGVTRAQVTLEVDIGPDGRVLEARVVGSGGRGFDESALAALRQFVFTPAEVDGAPAPVRIQYQYVFERTAQVVELSPSPDAGGPAPVNLRGALRLAGTREPIEGATITVGTGDDALIATSDPAGQFELAGVPVGQANVVITAPGVLRYETQEEIKPLERTEVTYVLRPGQSGVRETVVRGERDRKEVTQINLRQQEVRYVAGARGDAFRVVQNLPGVSRTAFGSGVLVVRGSKAWDSRVYVDDILIPQLFHFAGLNATFNSAVIDDISFQPGNFGAEFGRSIGGLVRGEVRTPSKTGVHGYVDVNFFDVSGLVEAPLGDDWSVSASARRGLVDLTLPAAIKTFIPDASKVIGFTLSPVYWDYQLRVERRAKGSKNRFFVSLYGSSDAWAFTQPNPFLDPDAEGNQGTFGTTNQYNRLTVGLDRRLSERVTFISRNSVGFDRYQLFGSTTDVRFTGTQVPIQLRERLRIEIPELNLTLSTGLDLLAVPAFVEARSPPAFKANLVPDPYVERTLQSESSRNLYAEPGLFLEAAWSPVPSLKVIAGVRADYESYMKKAWVDPRLAVRWSPSKWVTLKSAFGIFHQPPDYRTGQLSPIFGNPALLPEGARHVMAGVETRVGDLLELDVQGYYKDLFSQARQKLASGLGSDLNIPGAETRYSSEGYGRAYGAEFLLRTRNVKNFFGWVAYSLSRFERDYYGNVVFAPGPLDQPHNLIVVASYKFPLDFILGARVRFASGPLVTPFVSSLFDSNGNYYYPLPGLPWSERLPSFFQADVRLDKRFTFDAWALALYVDIQNVTNQQNAEGIFYNYDYTQKAFVYGIPILPTLGVRGEF